MITALRHFVVDTWIGRVIALLVFVAFIGLSGSFVGLSGGMNGMTGQDVAQVGSHKITVDDLERGIQQRLGLLQQRGVSPAALQSPGVAQEITQASLQDAEIIKAAQVAGERNGIAPSDELIRQTVLAMPEFHNAQGQFDAQKMDQLLQQNGMNRAEFSRWVQQRLFVQAVMFGFGRGMHLPSAEIDQIVQFYTRGRTVDVIRLPFADGVVNEQPSEPQLHRFYDNHPWLFRSPEFRHARIVALLPETVAPTIDVPDDVLRKVYQQREHDYNLPETRTVQVLGFSGATSAHDAARAWRSGASWEGLQKTFPKAIPASLPNARRADLPDEALAAAAFSARSGDIVGPVQTAAGWSVVRVENVTPAHTISFEQARDDMRSEMQQAEAATRLGQVRGSFEEAVAGSTGLDKIPSNLGAVPAAGMLDEHGLTPNGVAAPLPGDEATRKAILHQVFVQKKGELPHVVTLPNGGAFAVLVDEVQTGKLKPFDSVHTQVVMAWQAEQKKHAQEIRATSLYQAAQKTGLRAALTGQPENEHLQQNETFSRLQPRNDVPELIARAAFEQNVGKTAMLQAGDAYWLIQVTGQQQASSADEQLVRQKATQQLMQGLQGDVPESLGAAYMREAPPRHINVDLLKQVSAQLQQRLSGSVGQGQ